MADLVPLRCLSCRMSLESGDLVVFRQGMKIAHVRCWRPQHASFLLQSQQPDGISENGHRSASTLTGRS
jgi:hypothetical protein